MRKETIHKLNLYHGDCMEYMKSCKDNEFDLAIVDPPYFPAFGKGNFVKGVSTKGITGRHKESKHWDIPS